MKLSGAEILIACLKEQGVDTIFGYPGGAILDVYDALYRHRGEITHYLTSHEQGAAHAADGYARASGKVGVCFATSGPGATNLVTGIATAYMDSVPIVAITCNVSLPLLGKDSFQEVDITGITMPVTKHGIIVKRVEDLADTIRRAFAIARSGRPGPVLVDITKNVTQTACEYTPVKPQRTLPVKKRYTESDLQRAADAICRAKRPFIYVGGGAISSGASSQLARFVELVDAPVCDTLMGKGAFDGSDDRYTGMIGMHGTRASNFGISESDLIIALGARFDDRVIGSSGTFVENAKILHIDVDVAEINKNVQADYAVIGDLKDILTQLIRMIPQQRHERWVRHIAGYRKKYPLMDPEKSGAFSGQLVVKKLNAKLPADSILTTDVGIHQMWTAQYYTFRKPRTLISSGGLGTMGFGLGAAIGAKCAHPDRIVVNISGDGCFRMNMNELATASRYDIPVINIVMNNHVLGMVRQWQSLFYERHYSQTVLEDKVDFCKVAEGLGCVAFRAQTQEEFDAALDQAISSGRPALIECLVDPDSGAYPMVAPGMTLMQTFDKNMTD